MGATSLTAAAPRRRSFSLPSFRRPSAAERQEVLKNADDLTAKNKSVEEAARIQKASAWEWHTRGVGEALVPTRPTRRPPVRNPQASDQSCIDGKPNVRTSSNMPQKETLEPPLAESHRDASRFKAEAALRFTSGGAPPALPAPSGGPSTPLYDELELSTLRTHMADFVQHLQRQGTPANEQSSTAVGVDHGKSRSLPPSASNDFYQTRGGAGVAVISAGDRHKQLPTFLSSSAPVASASISFHKKPFSALQKLFRKVLSGSVPKCTKNSPQIIVSAPAVYGNPVGEPAEVLYDDVNSTNQYHHHHYIHHHHHHYHFSKIPEEQSSTILSRRRHSESGSSRPCTPNLVEAGSDEKEDQDEDEESRFAAYLARRRRRHSDTFSKYQLLPEKMKEESAKVESGMEFSRRYNSERFWASKIPSMAGKDNIAQPVEDEFDEGTFAGIRSRRRHSADRQREEPSLERTGGKSAGGAYVLGGGAGAGGGTQASMWTGRRRHSESSKETPEAGVKRTPSPGRPYWTSRSACHYVDEQGRHVVAPTPATATTAGVSAGLPPLYF